MAAEDLRLFPGAATIWVAVSWSSKSERILSTRLPLGAAFHQRAGKRSASIRFREGEEQGRPKLCGKSAISRGMDCE